MKKSYKVLCALGALLMGTASANAITTTWEGAQLNHVSADKQSLTMQGHHFSLTFAVASGEENALSYSNSALVIGAWQNGQKNYTLSWSNPQGATLSVSKVTISAESYGGIVGGRAAKAKLGANGAEVDIRNMIKIYTNVINANAADLAAGELPFYVNRSNFDDTPNTTVNKFQMEYSLVPFAPVLGDVKSAELDVTIDPEQPITLNLNEYFSAFGDFQDSISYVIASDNSATIADSLFFATDTGTYIVKAYIAAKENCHNASENSSEALTIVVNRIAPTLEVVKADSTISVSLPEDTIYSINMLDMLNYAGDGLAFAVAEGEAANLVIADSVVYATKAGDYVLAIASVEGPHYLASKEPVMVNLHVNVLENQIFVAIDTLDTLNVTLEQDSTVRIAYSAINLDAAIYVEQLTGELIARYNADSTITALQQSGEATFRIYQNQDEHFAAAEAIVTVTVGRIAPTLEVVKADSTISATVNEDNIYSIAILDMLNYAGDGLAFAVAEGEAANLVIADSVVYATKAGDYVLAIASVEGPRYMASEEPVMVNIHVTEAATQVETTLEDSTKLNLNDVLYDVFTLTDTLGMQFIVEPAGVIAYDPITNTLSAIAAGEATLKLYQPAIEGKVGEINQTYAFEISDPSALPMVRQANNARKVLHKGGLMIINAGKCYNALGARIR